MASSSAYLEHASTYRVKKSPTGFSWTCVFFAPFVPFFRGDWRAGLLYLLLSPFGSYFVLPFLYNRIYIKRLLKKGYKPINITKTFIPLGWNKPHKILASPDGCLAAVKQGVSWPSALLGSFAVVFLINLFFVLLYGVPPSPIPSLLTWIICVSLGAAVNRFRSQSLISSGYGALGTVQETSPEAAIISWILSMNEDKTEGVIDNTEADLAI